MKTLFTLTAYPEVGEGETMEIDIVAPNAASAHDTARAAYCETHGVPRGLVHTKIVARKEQLAR